MLSIGLKAKLVRLSAIKLWRISGLPTHQPIALLLVALLIAPSQLPAQQKPGEPAKAVQAADSGVQQPRPAQGALKILVLQGQNALNSLSSKSAVNPVVQVLDVLEQPVEGATVTFEVSPTGPGGSFANAPIATVKTDVSGQATAVLTPNDTPGSFSIKVTASLAGQTAETRIRQTNDQRVSDAMMPPPPKPWFKDWKWWTVIGAGAGAGIAASVILINRDKTSTITIGSGTIVIGGPR
jgi:hypothetical protein